MKREYLTIWHRLQDKTRVSVRHREQLHSLLEEVEQKIVKTVHEKPSKEALDRLALFVGYQDWQSFLDSFEEEGASDKVIK